MNKRLWIWITLVFAIFSGLMLGVELVSEYNYKKTILSSRLEGYADIVARVDDYQSTKDLLPQDIRVTVIRPDGEVIYDSFESAETLNNHLSRPEIAASLESGEGCSIRKSETSGMEYIYYARKYGSTIVRVALPFEVSQRRFLHPDWVILITVLLLFLVTVMAIVLISRRFNVEADKVTNQMLQTQKHQMTNNIAHELRTPVTSVRGYLETLVNNPEMAPEKRELFTERAYLQTLRLSELIRDIALITKIEEAPELLSVETLGVRKITEEVVDELSEHLSKAHITVNNEIPEGLSVKGNSSLVYAIFRNLVENTIRYAGEGVNIRIACLGEIDGKVNFLYSDNGKGVDPQLLDRIFERFYRIPSEERRHAEGSGLGLSIVRNAVAFHGGTVTASQTDPHGLTFNFSLNAV